MQGEMSFAAIGKALGISDEAARQACKRALRKLRAHPGVDRLRELREELDRLRDERAAWPLDSAGHKGATGKTEAELPNARGERGLDEHAHTQIRRGANNGGVRWIRHHRKSPS